MPNPLSNTLQALSKKVGWNNGSLAAWNPQCRRSHRNKKSCAAPQNSCICWIQLLKAKKRFITHCTTTNDHLSKLSLHAFISISSCFLIKSGFFFLFKRTQQLWTQKCARRKLLSTTVDVCQKTRTAVESRVWPQEPKLLLHAEKTFIEITKGAVWAVREQAYVLIFFCGARITFPV